MIKLIRDTVTLYRRAIKHILRSPDALLGVLFMPVAMMLMFVYVFGGAVKMSMGSDINYVNYQLPGIMVMSVSSGISYTTVRLFTDIQKGLLSRFHSMPITRSSVLWANVLVSLVSNFITLTIIVIAAFVIGFRPHAGVISWLSATGILMFFTLALTWLAILPGLTAKSVEGSYAFAYPLMFLPFLSSAFVPTETMPAALRLFAENQPVTCIVESVRKLLDGGKPGSELWVALIWCGGITIAAYLLSMRTYKKRFGG